MNCLPTQSLRHTLSQTLGTRIKADYNLSLSLYEDEAAEAPACLHNFTGSAKHSLGSVLACVGILVAFGAMLHGLCCLIAGLCEN